jgi:hypothetical protein
MYIIAKNKDYYDGVAGTMGIDKTIVYERNTVEIEDGRKFPKPFTHGLHRRWNESNPFSDIGSYNTDSDVYDTHDAFVVGFCGKLYVGWRFARKNPLYTTKYTNSYPEFLVDYSFDFDFAKNHIKDTKWGGRNVVDDYNYIDAYDPIDIFRELNAPVFVHLHNLFFPERQYRYSPRFYVNPVLKEFEFYKRFDAFTAFQEISMFIGGVLGSGEKEIIEVADEHKIAQHGFDKWSFRREPSKKR